jgi:competence protein ComEC
MSRTVPRKVSPWVVYLAVLLVFFVVCYAVWRKEHGGEGLLGTAPQYAYALPEERSAFVGEEGDALLRVTVLDVGQGDSALVELPDGKLMLVDAGDRDAGPKVRDWLLENSLTNIYCIVATHPHADHIGGFVDILKVIGTDLAYLPGRKSGATATTRVYKNFLKAMDKKNLTVRETYAGDYIVSNAVCVVKVLAPEAHVYEGLNNTSICLLVLFGKHKVLLTGDIETPSEKEILERFGDDFRGTTLLKVAHHGSKTSSCEEFLRVCEPDAAFISLGRDNEYHHPHPSLMKRLERWCGEIYRTDQEGTLTFISDGKQFEIQTAK